MNIGTIVTPNIKGQIVIPKKIRDELNINKGTLLNVVTKDDGIYIHPVAEVTTRSEVLVSRNALLDALEQTRGIWANDKDFDKRQKQSRKLELAAAKKMKKAW